MEELLLDLDYLKEHLNIKHDFSDMYLEELREGVQARFENYIDRPIFSTQQFEEEFHGGTKLILTFFPLDPDTVEVTDNVREEVIDSDEIQIDHLAGFVYRTSPGSRKQVRFHKGINRWNIKYNPGLDTHPNWERYYKRAVLDSLRDLAADWYEVRVPGLNEERFGGGSVISYLNREVSPRIQAVWEEIGRDIGI